jgi:alanyl-tRNA synthetase
MIGKTQTATQKLYEIDSELYEFDARVLACEPIEQGGYAVELDRTAFFPEGGGQYADRGTLDGVTVRDVQIKDDKIRHYTDVALAVDSTVHGVLDAEERFVRMQNHSGEHILSGIAHAKWGLENVGFHLGEREMTMDFDGELTDEQLCELELAANRAVWNNTAIHAEYPDAKTLAELSYRSKLDLTDNVRIVTIEGVDACACCAPHVKRTGEIGLVKIVAAIHHKGGMRLWVLCGSWALDDYTSKHEDILTITRRQSVKPWQAVETVDKLADDLLATRAALSAARRELSECKLAASTPDEQGNLLFFEQEMDANVQRGMADRGADRVTDGICGVFCATENGYRYVCVSRGKPLRAFGKELNAQLLGRGGGSDAMIQGTLGATREQIEEFFKQR